jgi:hypothetical protein
MLLPLLIIAQLAIAGDNVYSTPELRDFVAA